MIYDFIFHIFLSCFFFFLVFKANNLYKKVYSAENSEVCDLPYFAVLNITEENDTKTCSGAILDATHILTVAQCV